jgi:hypothetical protein
VKGRQPKVRVSTRLGVDRPEDLAKAVTDYLLGRTNQRPTIRLNSPRRAS